MDSSIIDLPETRLLREEETREYIKAAQKGDKEAINKLVEHNLKLVLKVAYRFKNTEYDLQDLFQIGVIGLIKAIEGFDLSRNVKFSTYAFSRILGQIRLHLRDDGMINVSRSLKKIARVVKQKEEELEKQLNRPPTINEIAEETGYSRDKIVQALEADKNPSSIYKPFFQDEGSELQLIDSLDNKADEKDITNIDKINLMEVLQKLDERSRKIIYLRYFKDWTQEEVGEKIGISQVQVSRLEKRILRRLKKIL